MTASASPKAGAKTPRQRFISLVKLVAVAGLLYWVFQSVQWGDVQRLKRGDVVVVETPGKIVGDWRGDQVEFQVEEAGGQLAPAQTVRIGPNEDGTINEVAPGFLTYVRNLDPWLFGLGALCYFLSVLIATTRWWQLLRYNRLDVTWVEAFRFTWIGIFFNNVVPGQTGGDVVKALYIMKHCHGGRVPAVVSVAVDRILGLGSLALLAAVIVLFDLERFGSLAVAIWAVVGGVALIGVIAFSKRIRRMIRLDQMLNALPGFLATPLQRIDQSVHFYRAHKVGIAVWVVIGMLNHVSSVMAVVLIGKALGVGMPIYEYFVLIPVINIISALPVGPNGWGIGEAAYRYLFGEYGAKYIAGQFADPAQVMGTRGVALSLLFRIHLTLWSLLGGVMLLFTKDRVTRAEVDAEIDAEAHDDVRLAEQAAHSPAAES